MQTDLLGYVLARLAERRFKLTDVAKGADVPYETLKKIASGSTPNPGVKHVQALANWFQKQDVMREANVRLEAERLREQGMEVSHGA